MKQSDRTQRAARVERAKRALLCMQRFSWEQGVTAQAFLESGDDETVVLLAKDALNRQVADGRLAFMGEGSVTDPAANGEAVLHAGRVTGDPAFAAAAGKMLEWLLRRAPRTADGTLHHIMNRAQIWVDSFYMAPPFIALMGEHQEALRQIEGHRRRLWDPGARLYSHKWDEEQNDFARKAFWGVGNGWAAAGMARVIGILPESMSQDKARLAGYVKEVLDGCLAHIRADGLFHDVVDDPGTFVETNLSQMLAYTIYRGVAAGWLDRDYLSHAEKMREAAAAMVDEFGLVQGVCGSPHFDHPGTAPEGQVFFLLMEAAAKQEKLRQNGRVGRGWVAPGVVE